MKEGDKITFRHKNFPTCGCSFQFNQLEIGKEYTISTIGKFDFGSRSSEGDIAVISLKDSMWGGFYPLSLFQDIVQKEEIYQIY